MILSFSCRPPAIDCNSNRLFVLVVGQSNGVPDQEGISWLQHCVPTELTQMISAKSHADMPSGSRIVVSQSRLLPFPVLESV